MMTKLAIASIAPVVQVVWAKRCSRCSRALLELCASAREVSLLFLDNAFVSILGALKSASCPVHICSMQRDLCY